MAVNTSMQFTRITGGVCLIQDGDTPPVKGDPFYESQENHNLIGVASVFLEALFYDVKLEYQVPIISQQGEVLLLIPHHHLHLHHHCTLHLLNNFSFTMSLCTIISLHVGNYYFLRDVQRIKLQSKKPENTVFLVYVL